MELLSKKLLSDIDNFLILELNLDSDEELAQRIFFHYKRRKNEKINMMHSLISEKCRTIDYNKCIKIIYNMFNNNGFNSKDKDILDELGKIRNSLVHIGGNEGNALYKIMILLNDSLQLITGFYRDNIEFGNEVIGNSLVERIDNIINISKEKITNLWLHSEMGFVQMILGEIIDEIKKKDSIINIDEKYMENSLLIDSFYIYYKINDNIRSKNIKVIYNEKDGQIFLIDENSFIIMLICTSYKSYKFWSHRNLIDYIFIARKEIKLGSSNQNNINGKGFFDKISLDKGLDKFIKKILL